MSFYWHFNESTGELVYSNASTYDDGSGGSWLALEQTNMGPTAIRNWAFDSYRSSIASIEWDETDGMIEGLTSMRYMLYDCSSLTSLDLSGFDTSQVTNMNAAIYYCSSLTSLDLSGFDTSQVTDMGNMFYGCFGLVSLDLSGFDTSQVTSKTGMFQGCSGLRILAISGSMSNVLPELPAAQYYSAAGGAAVARADLTAGTWIKDAGDLSVCTSLVDLAQARMALSRSVTKLAKRIAKMQ